jgi:DNA primase
VIFFNRIRGDCDGSFRPYPQSTPKAVSPLRSATALQKAPATLASVGGRGLNARVARLPEALIEQIAAANDIVDVVGGYFPLKRGGGIYKANCPFHLEKTPSFTVNPHKQIFKCFGCGAGGSVFQFVMQYENLDFVSAAKKLADRAGIRIEEQAMSAEDEARFSMRRRLLALHAEAADFFHHQLLKKPSAQIARDYLKGRGVGGEIAKKWKLGYAPEAWEAFATFAHERGYGDEEIVASGLVKLRDEEQPHGEFYDRFRGRVMFPICNDTGEVIAFSGRVLEADAKAAKYVNSPETMLFTKGKVLFGLHKSKRALIDKGSAIVCEGQLDLITAFENGVTNVIAPQGTAFTEQQAHLLKRYVEEVVLCFDADDAGEKAAEKSLIHLLAENLLVRVMKMPRGEDPDSLIRGKGAAAFVERVTTAKDFFDFQIERLTGQPEFATPRGKMHAIRKMVEFIGHIKEPLLRETVLQKSANRLNTSLDELRKVLKSPARSQTEADLPEREHRLALRPEVKRLCIAILRDPMAREWIRDRPWDEVLVDEPDFELLKKLIVSDVVASNGQSLAAFLATLERTEELTVLDLIGPEHGISVKSLGGEGIAQFWLELELNELKRREGILKDRCKAPDVSDDEVQNLTFQLTAIMRRQIQVRLSHPGLAPQQIERLTLQLKTMLTGEVAAIERLLCSKSLSPEEIVKLQKEVLDLTTHLSNIARPLSPPL